MILLSNQCVGCPPGKYPVNGTACGDCDEGCAACSGTSSNCSSCTGRYIKVTSNSTNTSTCQICPHPN